MPQLRSFLNIIIPYEEILGTNILGIKWLNFGTSNSDGMFYSQWCLAGLMSVSSSHQVAVHFRDI